MTTKTFTKTFFAYIKNDYNELDVKQNAEKRNTGWHVIPNQHYENYMSPLDEIWLQQQTWHKPVHAKTTIGHSIPITETAGLGGTGTLHTFNNTLYSLIYKDTFDILGAEITAQKGTKKYTEGIITSSANGNVEKLNYLPTLKQTKSNENTIILDPLQNGTDIYILYPGNNGYISEWSLSGKDENIFYKQTVGLHEACQHPNMDYKMLTSVTPRADEISSRWTWSCGKKPYREPIPNILIKTMPIFNTKLNLIPHIQLISISNTITIKYESNHKNIPSYNVPWRNISSNNQFGLKYVSAVSNMPGDKDRLEGDSWLLTNKNDASITKEFASCKIETSY